MLIPPKFDMRIATLKQHTIHFSTPSMLLPWSTAGACTSPQTAQLSCWTLQAADGPCSQSLNSRQLADTSINRNFIRFTAIPYGPALIVTIALPAPPPLPPKHPPRTKTAVD